MPVDDLDLAQSILAGHPRGENRFEARFGDDVDIALRHSREAIEWGLERESFARRTARAAAQQLLSCFPPPGLSARLDPFVTRVLSHRDFALATLFIDRPQRAGELFLDRYGAFLRALFLRCGKAIHEIDGLLAELVADLFGATAADAATGRIFDYDGSTRLDDWLYVFVRLRFGARAAPAALPDARRNTRSMRVVDIGAAGPAPAIDSTDASSALIDAFGAALAREKPADREILRAAADGATLAGLLQRFESDGGTTRSRSLAPSGVVQRHHTLVVGLWKRTLARLASGFGGRAAAEERAAQIVLDRVEAALTGVFDRDAAVSEDSDG